MKKGKGIFVRRVSQWHKTDNTSQLKGLASEERFLEVCLRFLEQGRFPEQIVSFTRGTKEDDPKKIDAWAHTAEGKRIPIQVKSSKREVEKFNTKEKFPHILCVAAGQKESDEDIFTATRDGLVKRATSE